MSQYKTISPPFRQESESFDDSLQNHLGFFFAHLPFSMSALSDLQVQRKSVSFSTGIVYTNITIATSRVYIFVVHFQVHSGVF